MTPLRGGSSCRAFSQHLNPKLTIFFFFASLPQVAQPGRRRRGAAHRVAQRDLHGGDAGGLQRVRRLAAAVRREVISRPRIVAWVRRSSAATYVILAVGRPRRLAEFSQQYPGISGILRGLTFLTDFNRYRP